ncbi:methyl-accepting chemotaxis protein [Geobacter sp. AOG1]|uniref:methyl-accepting chemotaxis protein n=1 Tax=Geobacter sp. AOG1 TaxID=1566346 RepID=UPI001CC65793|nr:HAMP domain-containing methyl-accepting chemotaxis protein [Geobacter sp. AOG1]GFE58182.1 methyl-accepting chemotaxis protein [Geobacter sp. AOG1]
MLKNLSLGTKLIGAFFLMAAIVAFTGSFGIRTIDRVGTEVNAIMKSSAAQEKQVLQMEMNQKACRVNLVEAALVRTERADFDKYAENYRKKNDLFKKNVAVILNGDKKLGVPPAKKGSMIEKQAQGVLTSWAEFEKVAEQTLAHKASLLKGLTPGVVDQAAKNALADDKLNNLARKQIMESSENAKLDIDDLADTVDSQRIQTDKESAKIKRNATMTFVAVIALSMGIAILLGMLITRSITRRISLIVNALHRGAEGDLTARVLVDSGDEMAKLCIDYNTMADRLSAIVAQTMTTLRKLSQIAADMRSASQQVVGAAEMQSGGVTQTSSAVIEISATIKEVGTNVDNLSLSASAMSSSTLEMAASVEEVALNAEILDAAVEEVSSSITQMTASIRQIGANTAVLMDEATSTACSIEQMNVSIREVEKNAMETASISQAVRKDAERGQVAVDATIAGITDIRRASRITTDAIESLSTRARDIGAILSVIDSVADQTNLLALNAAIIAAQAGEHGKGFAVVADEIKELAEQTSNSTREISQVIKAVQEESQRAVSAIKDAEQSISKGEQLSLKSGEALGQIVSGVERTSDQMDSIARATEEQAKGSQMIREAMERISEMVGQIAVATRQQSTASDMISGASERMKVLTGQVRLSTREQSKGGNFIAHSAEDITDMVQQIKNATEEQSRGSAQIVEAVGNIQQSAAINLQASKVMDEAVASLTGQMELMQKEMGKFKVTTSNEQQ